MKIPPTCVVLLYHSIPSEQRARFADQMDRILRHTKPVSAEGVIALDDGKNGQHYTVVTFDDGFESFVRNALPVLVPRHICATVFVITDYIGKTAGWARFDLVTNSGELLMSAAQLQSLPPELISIGSHTMTHPVLPTRSEPEAKREIGESRLKLQRMLQRDVKLFSFPYGSFNDDLVAWCREAGYERVFTILPSRSTFKPNEFVTGRVVVEPTDWNVEFFLKMMGAYRWQPRAFAAKRKMVSIYTILRGRTKESRAC